MHFGLCCCRGGGVCVAVFWKNLSGGRVSRSEAGGPRGWAEPGLPGSRASSACQFPGCSHRRRGIPVTQTPETALPFREKESRERSEQPGAESVAGAGHGPGGSAVQGPASLQWDGQAPHLLSQRAHLFPRGWPWAPQNRGPVPLSSACSSLLGNTNKHSLLTRTPVGRWFCQNLHPAALT